MGILTRVRNALSRSKSPDPSSSYLSIPSRQAGVVVTADSALKSAALWACVRYVSETIAGLPKQVFRMRASGFGKDREPDSDVEWLINREPNPEMTAFTFWEIMLAWAMTWGNGYAEIERVGPNPNRLWPISPDRVIVERVAGELRYRVWNSTGSEWSYVDAENMFHLRGLGFDGLVGYSVVSYFAQTIGVGLAAETTAASMFANSAIPGGIIEGANFKNVDAEKNFVESWEKQSKGPSKFGKVRVLPNPLTFKQIGMPLNDAQFLESREFGVVEIARIFRVPLHKIGYLKDAKYANIEQQNIDATTDCILPWVRRAEFEVDRKLIGRNNRGKVFLRINMNGLLRGDSVARGEHYTKMIAAGVYSVNEARDFEEMNPIEDGDKHVMQSGFTTLERIGEEKATPAPAPAGPPAAEPDDESQPDDTPIEKQSFDRGLVDALAYDAIGEAALKALRRERYIVRDAIRDRKDPVDAVAACRPEIAKLLHRPIRTYGLVLSKELPGPSIDFLATDAIEKRIPSLRESVKHKAERIVAEMEAMEPDWAETLTRGVMSAVASFGVNGNGKRPSHSSN